MSVLVDSQIREMVKSGSLIVRPFVESNLQPASIDLTAGHLFRRFMHGGVPLSAQEHRILDVKEEYPDLTKVEKADRDSPFILGPLEFALASSHEWFEFPDDMVGRLEGKSSLGRLGLLIHSTAGFFDPGFCGTATLELFNVNMCGITIYPGMPIAQMSFFKSERRADVPYASKQNAKYRDQKGPTPSRYFENFR